MLVCECAYVSVSVCVCVCVCVCVSLCVYVCVCLYNLSVGGAPSRVAIAPKFLTPLS